MKIKVSIFDKRLFSNYLADLSVISLLTSFGLIAFQLPDDFSIRVVAGIIIFALLVIVFLAMWVHANLEKSASLNFNNSTVEMNDEDTLRPEYPADLIKSGVRGKYVKRYREETNIVVISPELHKLFPDSDSVNKALREYAKEHGIAA